MMLFLVVGKPCMIRLTSLPQNYLGTLILIIFIYELNSTVSSFFRQTSPLEKLHVS